MAAAFTVSRLATCRVEWQIIDFSYPSLMGDEHSMDCEYCEYFEFFDIPLSSLRLCDRRESGLQVYLRLGPSSPESKVYDVAVTFGIRKADGSVGYLHHEDLSFAANERQRIAVLKTSLLHKIDKWFSNGKLTLIFHFGLVDVPGTRDASLTLVEEKNNQILVKNLEDLLTTEREADVTLNVSDQRFKAHKAILVARSSVFALMFENDMVEKKTCVVNIEDCAPDVFPDFLMYMYTGKTGHITPGKAVGLYTAADKYDFQELKLVCVQCMRDNLSLDTFCDVISIATIHGESELVQAATDFFIQNLKDILRIPKWAEFHATHTELVSELLLKLADGMST